MPKALCEKPFHTKDEPSRYCNEAIAAEEFRLVDKNGNVRAVLELNEDGQPRLLFFDKDDKLRISFYVENEAPGVELLDTNEITRAALGLGSNGQPSLQLLDKNEKVHALLQMGEDGRPGLDFYDRHGELRSSLSLMEGEMPLGLTLVDKNGRLRLKPGEMKDGEPILAFYDKDGEMCDMLGGECDEGSA